MIQSEIIKVEKIKLKYMFFWTQKEKRLKNPIWTLSQYIGILSLFICISCESKKHITPSNTSSSLVDNCTLNPGPNCCNLAFNGLCEEPFGCFLGTDGDDCRGLTDFPSQCTEAPIIGQANQWTRTSFSFTWTGEDEGISFTLEPFLLQIPDDLESVSISIVEGDQETGLNWGLNGRPLRSISGSIAATGALPYNKFSNPEPGCLAIWPLVEADRLNQEGEVFVVGRRFEIDQPILKVKVIIVGETDVLREELDEAFEVATRIYEQNQGPKLKIIEWFNSEGESMIPSEGSEINRLRASTIGDHTDALNIYLIDDFTEGDGTLGIAGGIPGPNGTPPNSASGLVVAIEPHLIEDADGEFSVDYNLIGSTIAHELGHQLGLEHTTDDDGTTSSPITDVVSCAYEELNESTPELCPDGRNLMFWTSGNDPQEELSVTQVNILNRNPIIHSSLSSIY
jgi:hypothetical protein